MQGENRFIKLLLFSTAGGEVLLYGFSSPTNQPFLTWKQRKISKKYQSVLTAILPFHEAEIFEKSLTQESTLSMAKITMKSPQLVIRPMVLVNDTHSRQHGPVVEYTYLKELYTQLLCAQWMFSLFRDGKLSNKQVLDTLAQLTPQKRSLQTAYFLSQITFFTRTKHTLDADAREQWEQLYQQLLSLLAADLLHCSEQERNTALFWLYDNEQCSQCSLQLDLSRYIEDSTIRDAVLQKAVEGIQKYLIDSKYERNLKTAVDLYLTSAEQLYGGEVEKQILGKLVDWRTFERAAEPELKNYAYDKWHYAYIRAKWQLFLLAKYAQLHPGAEKTLKWLKEWRTRLPNIANEESGTNLTGS